VKIGSGPAAVSEDETRLKPLSIGGEGAGSRRIPKPEDLPVVEIETCLRWFKAMGSHKGVPIFFIVKRGWGFFLLGDVRK